MKAKASATQNKPVKVPAPQIGSAGAAVAVPASIETAGITDGITVEMLLYALIVIVAGALRLINLGAAPLSAREAEQALAAFNGTSLPAGGSPLLYSFNHILFGLLGTNLGDVGVRLGAALIGTAMLLLPVLYRKQIGRVGALAASAMMAISPTMAYASRTIDGQLIAAACALAAVGCGLRYFDSQQRRDLIALAITIGLGVTSGSGIVTLIIVIGLGSLIVYRWAVSDDDRTQLWRLREHSDHLRAAGMWGGVIFVLVSTAMLMRPGAIGYVPELASAWLNASRGGETMSALQVFQNLLVYEPLIVLVGLVGLVVAVMRGHAVAIVLSVWSIGALIVALLQPGRQAIDLVLMLTPLAMLGGQGVQWLGDALTKRGAWQFEGAFWLIAAPLIGYLAVTLSSYAMGHNLIGAAQVFGQALGPLASFIVLLGLLSLIVSAVFTLAMGLGVVARAAATTLIVVLALIAMASTWGVTQLHTADPRELLGGPTVTTSDVRDLVRAVQAASIRATGQPNHTPMTIALPESDPVLHWYLRDFATAQAASDPNVPAVVVITPLGVTPPANPGEYVGAKFVTQSMWSVSSLNDTTVLRWLLYREAERPTPVQTWVVWVKTAQS